MLFSAVAFGALAPANVPAHGLDLFDRPGRPAQIGRHVGEINAWHRFRTAASCIGRGGATQSHEKGGRANLQHPSLLTAGRGDPGDVTSCISSGYSGAINGRWRRPKARIDP
jgi:hypothetical protein